MRVILGKAFRRFSKDESGLALTEYLILLGLLTGAVIAAVLLFGTQLGLNWGSWGEWMEDTALEAPPPPVEPPAGG